MVQSNVNFKTTFSLLIHLLLMFCRSVVITKKNLNNNGVVHSTTKRLNVLDFSHQNILMQSHRCQYFFDSQCNLISPLNFKLFFIQNFESELI